MLVVSIIIFMVFEFIILKVNVIKEYLLISIICIVQILKLVIGFKRSLKVYLELFLEGCNDK